MPWIIRHEQMRALGQNSQEAFVARLSATLSTQWPDQVHDLGPEYSGFVRDAIRHAMSYGLKSESSVARFVNLYFVWGDRFETLPEHAWALRILNDDSLDGEAKIHELAARTTAKLWMTELNRAARK